jgi:hypothetical protein
VEQNHEPQPTEEDIKAAHANVLKTTPSPRYASMAVLQNAGGGKITYLGMDVDAETVAVGQPFTLTHYYRVEQPVPEGWRLFVHLDSPDRRGHLTADHVPVSGKYPVPRWQAGEIIRDIHKVVLPSTWPSDKVQVYVGFWKGQERFSVASGRQDGKNRVFAAELPVRGAAPPPPPKRLLVRKLRPGTVITIDGKLDEPAWREANTTGLFVNTLDGSPVSKPALARVLWDDNNLYVAFELQDADIISSMEKHDDKLWTQDAAEMFIDADGDRKTYVELQVSPRNVTFDSWLPSYRANDNAWDSGMVTAVQLNGTLNKSDDTDTSWTAEVRIPLTAAKGRMETMGGVPPKVGTEWRVNFFRMDSSNGKPQAASGWSPPLVGDFHALDRFGLLVFADEQGIVPAQVRGAAGGVPMHPVSPLGPATAGPVVPSAPPSALSGAPPAGGQALPPALQRAMLAHPQQPPPPHPPVTSPAKAPANPN